MEPWLERVCSEYPGKVHEPMLLPPSAHHYYTMVDILPDIKILAIANQKQTRNSTKLTIGVLIGVDMSTKYSQFVLISYKSEPDLAQALTSLCAKARTKHMKAVL